MSRKIDWNSYVGTINKYGVKILKWVEEKEKHTRDDAVVCLCPECNKEFIPHSIRVVCGIKKQIHMCKKCAHEKLIKKQRDNSFPCEGEIYNNVMILKRGNDIVYSDNRRRSSAVCKCLLCEKIFTSLVSNIKKGTTKSCGCMKSWLEAQTEKFLTAKGIHFIHGFWIEDILTDNGNSCQMDFQIEDEHNNRICFIECQGVQHYDDSHGYFGKIQREETDIKKKNYCREHNILLYEIRYDEDVETAVDNILTELKKKGLI